MKRLLHIIATAACLALPATDLAMAQGRGHGRGQQHGHDGARAEQRHGPPGRGGDGSRFDRRDGPPRGHGPPSRFERRWEDRGDRWDDDRPPPRAFAPQGARRGGYLPDRFRGGVVEDYRRYRLRPPPHGYAWVRVGNGFALVSEASGQVFDIIPD